MSQYSISLKICYTGRKVKIHYQLTFNKLCVIANVIVKKAAA
jgi:hypothetical protein